MKPSRHSPRSHHLVWAGLAVLAAACGPNTRPTTYRRDHSRVQRAPLGINDTFSVRVFGEAELSQDYRIQPDGTIDFPYLGRIAVAGHEAPEVAAIIRTQLRDHEILVNPQVSVLVTAVNSRRISIFGAVQRPGMQDYIQSMDLIMVITAAGGFTPVANHSVRITRRLPDGTNRVFSVNVDGIIEGGRENFDIEPGDIIFVSESIV